MSPRQRIMYAIVLGIIALAGVGLVLVSRLDPIIVTYDTQKTVCNFEYQVELNPLQTLHNNCAVLQNDWLQLSVESNLNITILISLAKVGGGQITVFNNTSTNLNASFPITENGAVVSVLTNSLGNVSSVNGSLLIFAPTLANTTSLTTTHPYRPIGEALVGLGALGILVVIWNPAFPGVNKLQVNRKSTRPV